MTTPTPEPDPRPDGHNWQGFIRDAAERAVKTAAQVAVLVLIAQSGGDAADGTPLFDALAVDWAQVGRYALGGGALSLLTSVASIPVGDRDSASLVK